MARKAQSFKKDPSAILDFGFDWSEWLASGEIIASSVWTLDAGIATSEDSYGDTTTVVWISGGLTGFTYTVTNTITTTDDRTDERSFELVVEDR